jgi:hypothetical protein
LVAVAFAIIMVSLLLIILGFESYHENRPVANWVNPDTNGDGLIDSKTARLDPNPPMLDLKLDSVALTRSGWGPQIDATYHILADNIAIDPSWIYDSDIILKRLNFEDFHLAVNGQEMGFSPALFEISVPINLSSTTSVKVQYGNYSIERSFQSEQTNSTMQSISAYWANNTMPVGQGPVLQDAIDSMQKTFDDYAFVISGLYMMERHIQDLKNMIDWDSSGWITRAGSLGSNINMNAPLEEVFAEFEKIFANSTKTYIETLESQVQKVWIDVQALKTFPWNYVSNYATENSRIPTYLLDSMINRILNPEDDLQWFDLFVGGGIDTLKGIYNQLCSDYYGWINGTSPIRTIRYVSDHAKWYIDNIDHIRHVMTYDHTDGLLRGPVELVSWKGQSVVPWFSAGYTFDFIYNPDSAMGNPFNVENEIPTETTQLQYEPSLRLDYDLYPRGPQYYRACLATESRVQEYLKKYGFWVPSLPPTSTEKTEFGKIRNASKYFIHILNGDPAYFLGNDSLAQNLKIMANSYDDFENVDQTLSTLRTYKTSDNFIAVVNRYLWHLRS